MTHEEIIKGHDQLIGATITCIDYVSGTGDYDQECVPRIKMTAQDGQELIVYVHAMGNAEKEAALTITRITNE